MARKGGVWGGAVGEALGRVRALGLLDWQRRSRPEPEANGGYRQVQETNAYAVLPPSHWRGYHEPPPAPPPEPGTWGDHPPLPSPIEQAAADLAAGSSHRSVLAALGSDPGDLLADARARRRRAVLGPQHSR